MKIGYFTDTYYPQLNGVTISVDHFAQMLRKQGHTVYLFAPKIKNYNDIENDIFRIRSVKIMSSEPEVMFPLLLPEASMRMIFNMHLDIIHAHGNGPFSFLGYQVAKAKKIPFVMTFHNLHTKYTHYFFNGKVIKPRMVATGLRMFGNLCNSIIVPSEKMKRELLRFGVKKTITVVPNFVDTSRFGSAKKGYLHELLDLPLTTPLLLSVGRLGKEKNFAFLLKTFAKLSQREKLSHLVIVGQGVEEEALKKLTRVLNIARRVHFTGSIVSSEMPKVYADATIFVFASISETQGLCVLEAAAAGLPLVVAKDLAYQEIVEDGKDGYLLPLNQTIFSKTILSLLHDPERLHHFGVYARKRALAYSQPEELTEKLVECYKTTIATYYDSPIDKNYLHRRYLVNFLRVTERLQKFFDA